ncbi:hypothetical protein BC937DRAFT_94754 [Endogone sp. FLAS-F59071]|nr:hypothetical protein BC937DRAFT_94754 [Endogone sp. FLAS-F59071]|eukprot:RUS13801.1 hypothetical protein BC937DRAFT_94754 [Endogone sp. FLAS-F59071]
MAQEQLANPCPATKHIRRDGFTFQWKAILLFLLLQSLCGPMAVATQTVKNTLPSPEIPPYRNYSYPQENVQMIFDCTTFSDNSVTFIFNVATDLEQDQWHATIRTVYPNNTMLNSTLLWMDSNKRVQNIIRLSNGNILLLYISNVDVDPTHLSAAILTPHGKVIKNPMVFNIWDFHFDTGELEKTYTPRSAICAASVSTDGFLCSGMSSSDFYSKPVWAYFDNDGNMHPSGLQSLPSSFDSYIIKDVSWCTSGHVEPTIDGGFLLTWSFDSPTENATLPGSMYGAIFSTLTYPGTPILSVSPFIIYEAISYNDTTLVRTCAALQFGGGFSCIMMSSSQLLSTDWYLQVQFLSSGTILNVEMFSISGDVLDIVSLYYGGVLVSAILPESNDLGFRTSFILYDENLKASKVFMIPSLPGGTFPMCATSNNTVFTNSYNLTLFLESMMTIPSGWSYMSFDVPRFLEDGM